MKILKLFGAVIAVHAAVFMFIFAIPGCRSTGKQKGAAAESLPADAQPNAATINYAGGVAGETPTVQPPASFDPNAPAAPYVLFAPTRPNSAAATAVQTQAPTDTTPAQTYTVAKGDSLWSIAKKQKVRIDDLLTANNLKSNATLRPGQKLIVPGKSLPGTASAVRESAGDLPVHVVKSGETLASIARRYGTTVPTLRTINNLKSDTVRTDMKLALPPGTAIDASSGASDTVAAPTGGPEHVVQPGETLGSIARRYRVSVAELGALNNISNPSKLRPGTKLVMPAGARAASSTQPATIPAPAAPVFSLPAADQDLDAGLAPDAVAVPVIKIEDAGTPAKP